MARGVPALFLLLAAACSDGPRLPAHDVSSGKAHDAAGGPEWPDTPPAGDEAGVAEPDPGSAGTDAAEPDAGLPPDTGQPCKCDDGDPCTKDVCLPSGQCQFVPKASAECAPMVTVATPKRASWLYGDAPITVAGTVHAPAGLDALTLNGAKVTPLAGGTWSASMGPSHGINVISARVKDLAEVERSAAQAFVAADAYFPTTGGPGTEAAVSNGMVARLAGDVWDDDDPSDADDLATLAMLVLGTLDVSALIADSATGEGAGPSALWCEWDVEVTDVGFTLKDVDLVPMPGGLALAATIQNLKLAFSATDPTFACPDAIGTANIDTVEVKAHLMLGLDAAGGVDADVTWLDIAFSEPDIDVTGGFASLFDWLVDWVAGPVTTLFEDEIEAMLVDQVAPMIAQALETFSKYEKTFSVPSIMDVTAPVEVSIGVSPTFLELESQGATVGLGVYVVAPKGVPSLKAEGSVARNGCFTGEPKPFEMPKAGSLALALHDDVLNQVLFAAWWGGAMHVEVPPEKLLGLDTGFDLSQLVIDIAPELPPMLTSCTPKGFLQLQLGDARVTASFTLNDAPGGASVYLSGRLSVSLFAAPGPSGKVELGIKLLSLDDLAFQVMSTSGFLEGAEGVIETLMGSVLTEVIVKTIEDGYMQSFPLPAFDLSKVLPSLPAGTTIGLAPKSLTRDGGYTVLALDVAN